MEQLNKRQKQADMLRRAMTRHKNQKKPENGLFGWFLGVF
jgi:hypothetical protein